MSYLFSLFALACHVPRSRQMYQVWSDSMVELGTNLIDIDFPTNSCLFEDLYLHFDATA